MFNIHRAQWRQTILNIRKLNFSRPSDRSAIYWEAQSKRKIDSIRFLRQTFNYEIRDWHTNALRLSSEKLKDVAFKKKKNSQLSNYNIQRTFQLWNLKPTYECVSMELSIGERKRFVLENVKKAWRDSILDHFRHKIVWGIMLIRSKISRKFMQK